MTEERPKETASTTAESGTDRSGTDEATQLLTSWTAPAAPPTVSGPAPESIGPYRIRKPLGAGGMGVVYLARQRQPVERDVALKIIRSVLTDDHARLRFEAERQAMARLSHPNVAQIYEAGTTDEGFPYFVMELIDGPPITAFCDRERLDLRARLKLFLTVCRAVEHAHRKGIIHRDIKPSNVLVGSADGRAAPKIIDFGIAKAVDDPLVDGGLVTGDRVLGTPAYLPPEAASPDGDVDTQSDVYSLGILLYELLAGVRPFETQGQPFPVTLRRIVEEEPSRPSGRVSSLEIERREAIAAVRGRNARRLIQDLRSDLDWIVLRAIEKDRSHRYGSAEALATDIERYLDDEPIEARPPSWTYRVRKAARRHRPWFLAAALVLVSLVGGVVATGLEARRANREAAAARAALAETRETSKFLQELFEVSDPGEARGNSITARELLDRGAAEIRERFDDQPLVRARFMQTIGAIYHKLGLLTAARPLFDEALATREELLPEDDPERAETLESLGWLLHDEGNYAEAVEPLTTALGIQEGPHGDPVRVGAVLTDLGDVLRHLGDYAEAEAHLRRALEVREAEHGSEAPEVAETLDTLGVLYQRQEQFDAAEPYYRRAIAIYEAAYGTDHPSVARSYNNVGVFFGQQGRYDEAMPYYLSAIEVWQKVYGEDHLDMAQAYHNLGAVYRRQQLWSEAESYYRRALDIRTRVVGESSLPVSLSWRSLGILNQQQQRWTEAENAYRRAVEINEGLDGEELELARSIYWYGTLLNELERWSEAEPWLARALALQRALPADHPRRRATADALGEALRSVGRDDEAARIESTADLG